MSAIQNMSEFELLQESTFEDILKRKGFDKTQTESLYMLRAKELQVTNTFKKTFQAYIAQKVRDRLNSSDNTTQFTGQEIELFSGDWVADDSGISKHKFNMKTGEETVEEASRMPVLPTEQMENIDTGIHKVKLAYKTDKWKSVVVEKSVIASSTKIVELSNKGLDVTTENSKLLVKYLYDCITLNQDTIPKKQSISRLGWVEDRFMPYDGGLEFDGEKEYKSLYESIALKGSLSDWVEFIKPLRQNLYFRLQMAASFSSVLIEKVNALPYVLHLWGGTGSGKTVGLMSAMSIWGNPAMGKLTRTMNMTQNSMMATAGFLHHVPFAGDELQTIKSRYDNYDQLIMKVTEGVERGRMTFNTVNETKTWACAFLFTGEEPCTKSSSGGGTKNRVIEVECLGKVVEDGNKIVSFIKENYGTAGAEFINKIKDRDLKVEYEEILRDLLKDSSTTEKQAMSMALILLADKLSCEILFNDAALTKDKVNSFLFSEKEVDISERAYDFANSLFVRYASNFSLASNDVWGKVLGEGVVLIDKQVLCEQLSKQGYEFDAIKRKWAERGYLEKNSQGKFYHTRRIGNTSTMFVKINTKYLDDDLPEKCPF